MCVTRMLSILFVIFFSVSLFCNLQHNAQTLLGAAKTGYFGIKKQSYRSIAWRVFLGVLPGNQTCKDWKVTIQESRRRYEIIRAEHIPDFSKSVSDPLSTLTGGGGGDSQEDGVWASYYKMSELR
jgi:hypothetical protein